MFFLLVFLVPFAHILLSLFFLVLRFFSISLSLSNVFSFIYSRVRDPYDSLTDGEVSYGEAYSIIQHYSPFVMYQGTKTTADITVVGVRPLPSGRRLLLQKRGYRTGLLGWALGGLLGGSKHPDIDVTPVMQQPSATLPSHLRADIIRRFNAPYVSSAVNQTYQETMRVHIPVSSGDGYFRLRITSPSGGPLADSPVFRVGSATWSSAQTQGASPLGLVPELAGRSAFLAAKTASDAAFYASSPFLELAEYTPGPWRQFAFRMLYSHVDGAQFDSRLGVLENVKHAQEMAQRAQDEVHKKVPFGAVGVRTAMDVERDEEMGKGGVWWNVADD